MAELDRQTFTTRARSGAVIDEGLRAYMLKVYNYMGIGLVVTGLVAYGANAAATTTTTANAVAQSPSGQYLTQFGVMLYTSPLAWLIMLAPLAFVFALSFGINRMQTSTAQIVFWVFAAVMGLSLSSIFLVYTGTSIARVFFISAAMFGATSLYGYTTKRDLTAFGSFLFMGLIGLIIALVVNIFLASSMMAFIISIVGVGIFTGLAAYDTQRIKESYWAGDGVAVMGKKAIMGALSLYLDFLNLFLMLLRIMGNRN